MIRKKLNQMEKMLMNYNYETVIRKIFAFKYYPKILNNNIIARKRSSILLILKGEYYYKFKDFDFIAKTGETVYLPQGATYTYEILSKESEVMQVEFILEEKLDTEIKTITYSNNPTLIRENSNEIRLLFENILYFFPVDKHMTILKLYDLILLCRNNITQNDKSYDLILPAIQYLESHITEKIYLEELAHIVNISQAHLRRLFLKHLGMSPIKYKNHVLIKCACNMLLYENMNVSETAEALNFADIYTFSQFFKKEKGISPKKYIQQKNNILKK